jgi:S-adenosylmethionine uptake transporter
MRLPHPIFMVCLAVLFGCTLDATMKATTLGGTGVITATAWRYILAALIMLVIFVAMRKPMPGWNAPSPRPRRPSPSSTPSPR